MNALVPVHNDNHRTSLARVKLEELVARGRLQAGSVIKRILADKPTDHLIPARSIGFRVDDATAVHAVTFGWDQPLHPHALRQVVAKVRLPTSYLDRLLAREAQPWGPELLTLNLQRLWAEANWDRDEKLLFRSVGGVTRGVLSNRFRRLDSPIIMNAFCEACGAVGALPCDGFATDTRVSVRAIVPTVYEPIAGEALVFGVNLQTSDYGAGSLVLNVLVVRLVCSNGLLLDRALRQVHLGKRIEGGAEFSVETHELDARTIGSAINDVVRAHLAPARLDELQAMVRMAGTNSMTGVEVEALLKKAVTRPEAKAITEAYDSNDVVAVPAGQTRWRLAQAMSWIAGRTQDPERRTELMTAAGAVLQAA